MTLSLSATKPVKNGIAPALPTIAGNVSIDNPHYSAGAAGVIAKVRYYCYGTQSATLTINGNIYRYAPGVAGPYAPKASHNGSRAAFPGADDTFYIPAQTQSGISCYLSHWYFAGAYVTLSAGPAASSGYAESNTVHPQTC